MPLLDEYQAQLSLYQDRIACLTSGFFFKWSVAIFLELVFRLKRFIRIDASKLR